MYIYYILFINMLKISVFMKTLEVFVKSDIWTLLTCSFCCLFLPFFGGGPYKETFLFSMHVS